MALLFSHPRIYSKGHSLPAGDPSQLSLKAKDHRKLLVERQFDLCQLSQK